MGDKSFVGLDNCIICGEAKGIVIDRRLTPRFERENITSIEPCEKCQEAYLKEGVMLIYVGEGTFDLTVIREEAFKAIFNQEVPTGIFPTNRIVRCEKEVLIKLREMEDKAKEREENK